MPARLSNDRFARVVIVEKHVAVVGATGAVGRIVLKLLEERAFPLASLKLLASERSSGKALPFRGESIEVQTLRPEAFNAGDLVIASTPDEVAREFIPWAVERGAVVVDESGAWRMDPNVPVVVPEVNPQAVSRHQGIIASPNCSTTQMVVALKPLHDAARVRRVVVSTYQATSGAGTQGAADLVDGTRAALDEPPRPYDYRVFAHPIAFNLIPQIGSLKEAGYTSEELKMVYETHKIFDDDSMRVCPTCVRVPVANCHSEAILVETDEKLSAAEARELFEEASGIEVIDDLANGRYPMPLDGSGRDEVFVGRIREDLSCNHGIAFWCVADNLRKGAATNAVQIAELLVRSEEAG